MLQIDVSELSLAIKQLNEKMDKILSLLQPEAPKKRTKQVSAPRKTKRDMRVEDDLLMGFTRDEIITRNGAGPITIYKNYDPQYDIGDTPRASLRRVRDILDMWFKGHSIIEIVDKYDHLDYELVQMILEEYYAKFNCDIFEPLPRAKAALADANYDRSSLVAVSKHCDVPLVQVVRDWIIKGPLTPPNCVEVETILRNHLISAKTLSRDLVEIYYMEPAIQERFLANKPISLTLNWIDVDRKRLYRIVVKEAKYFVETMAVGKTRWMNFKGCMYKSDPDELIKILDGMARRQIRGA